MRTEGAAEVTFGVGLYTGQSTRPGRRYADAADLAVAAEEAGFDVFWVSEHHGWTDGYVPSPLVLLGAVAQATSRIVLATGVVIAPLHAPLRLAEDAAVLDHLSDGRLLLGLGAGYLPEEFAMFGMNMAGRGGRVAETVEILRRAWSGEPFTWSGRHFDVGRSRVTPRPLQSRIPIWLGGYAAPAIRRAAELADGHLVGRGDPGIVAAAAATLALANRADDPSFTFGINVAAVVDAPAASPRSARDAFARQQLLYERRQTGTDVYAGLLPAGLGGGGALALGDIDGYLQTTGDADTVALALADMVASLAGWPRVHLALRILFPGEETDRQLRRIELFGDTILPTTRAAIASRGS